MERQREEQLAVLRNNISFYKTAAAGQMRMQNYQGKRKHLVYMITKAQALFRGWACRELEPQNSSAGERAFSGKLLALRNKQQERMWIAKHRNGLNLIIKIQALFRGWSTREMESTDSTVNIEIRYLSPRLQKHIVKCRTLRFTCVSLFSFSFAVMHRNTRCTCTKYFLNTVIFFR